MSKKVGYAAKLYGGAAGSTPSTLVSHAKDVKVTVDIDTIDATDRSNGGWKDNLAGLKDATLSFHLVYDSEDTNYPAIKSAAMSSTPYAFKADNGNGGGLDADWTIKKFEESQENSEAIGADVECIPYTNTRTPTWSGDTPAVSGGGSGE